jgi:hypothetical protein
MVWGGLPFVSNLQLDGYSHKIRETLHSNLTERSGRFSEDTGYHQLSSS